MLEEVVERVQEIADNVHDPEKAHTLEDRLYLDVIDYLFDRAIEVDYSIYDTDILRLTHYVRDIKFPRWTR